MDRCEVAISRFCSVSTTYMVLLSWLAKPFIVIICWLRLFTGTLTFRRFEADHLAFLRFGVPALLAFWIYSSWVSGKRTLPLFTEVTHALTALPITLTLLSAAAIAFWKTFQGHRKRR